MALTVKDITGLSAFNLGGNQIGRKGCEYLSQAKWPNLTHLYLPKNNIMSEGVKWICKSNWHSLEVLYLRTFLIFRFQPNWERRVPRIMQSKME